MKYLKDGTKTDGRIGNMEKDVKSALAKLKRNRAAEENGFVMEMLAALNNFKIDKII